MEINRILRDSLKYRSSFRFSNLLFPKTIPITTTANKPDSCANISDSTKTNKTADKETVRMHALMTDVLMAQDFQDLTGQVIRKVIDLVREVEDSLINMLTAFGMSSETEEKAKPTVGENLVEGPIVNSEGRDDVVNDQDDVDDLLSSLGF